MILKYFFIVRLANVIIKAAPSLRIFVVLGNPGSNVALKCQVLNPIPLISNLMP